MDCTIREIRNALHDHDPEPEPMEHYRKLAILCIREQCRSNIQALQCAMKLFGWDMQHAKREVLALSNSTLCESQIVSRHPYDSFTLETADRVMELSKDGVNLAPFFLNCTEERKEQLREAMKRLPIA